LAKNQGLRSDVHSRSVDDVKMEGIKMAVIATSNMKSKRATAVNFLVNSALLIE
jgi:hypothetical protein